MIIYEPATHVMSCMLGKYNSNYYHYYLYCYQGWFYDMSHISFINFVNCFAYVVKTISLQEGHPCDNICKFYTDTPFESTLYYEFLNMVLEIIASSVERKGLENINFYSLIGLKIFTIFQKNGLIYSNQYIIRVDIFYE